jgi:hypothetical protein
MFARHSVQNTVHGKLQDWDRQEAMRFEGKTGGRRQVWKSLQEIALPQGIIAPENGALCDLLTCRRGPATKTRRKAGVSRSGWQVNKKRLQAEACNLLF